MTSRLRRVAIVSMLVASVGAARGARLPGDAGATLVVDVSARDASGAAIAALAPADVEVLVDGVAVPVLSVTPAPAALNVVLLIDHSASVPLKRSEVITAISAQWLPALQPGDRARLAVLSSPIAFGPWLNTARPAFDVRAFLERAGGEPSPIWDAVDAAAAAVAGFTAPKAIIVITDGRATGNALGLEDLAFRAAGLEVSISSVSEADEKVLPQGRDPATRVRPDASLEWLAEQTGGIYLEDGIARRNIQPRADPFGYVRELMNTPNQPGLWLTRITSLLRQRHLVSFAGPDDGHAHRLDVRARRSGVTIAARKQLAPRSAP